MADYRPAEFDELFVGQCAFSAIDVFVEGLSIRERVGSATRDRLSMVERSVVGCQFPTCQTAPILLTLQ